MKGAKERNSVQTMMLLTTGLTNVVDILSQLVISVTQIFGFVIFGNSTILHPYLNRDSVV